MHLPREGNNLAAGRQRGLVEADSGPGPGSAVDHNNHHCPRIGCLGDLRSTTWFKSGAMIDQGSW